MRKWISVLILLLLMCFSASAQRPCAGTPGNTTGNYLALCVTTAGAIYQCNNQPSCSLAAQWVQWFSPSQLPVYAVGANIASAGTIAPTSPVTLITGTTAINTITPPLGCGQTGFVCELRLVADKSTGPFTLGTSGNIAAAVSPAAGKTVLLDYLPATSLWYPNN